MLPARVAYGGGEVPLSDLPAPLPLDRLVPGAGPWEAELGFGKGRYLLGRAAEEPGGRFLGIEVASRYYRLLRDRAARHGLRNLVLVRGEALYLLAAALPGGFARAVHAYFPDPWPKSRHQKRRLFDVETVDLVLGLLAPGGRLYFATDHLEYGAAVREILESHGAVRVAFRRDLWADGPRTNYEAKYVAEGRPIARLEVTLEATLETSAPAGLLHPRGRPRVLAAHGPRGPLDPGPEEGRR